MNSKRWWTSMFSGFAIALLLGSQGCTIIAVFLPDLYKEPSGNAWTECNLEGNIAFELPSDSAREPRYSESLEEWSCELFHVAFHAYLYEPAAVGTTIIRRIDQEDYKKFITHTNGYVRNGVKYVVSRGSAGEIRYEWFAQIDSDVFIAVQSYAGFYPVRRYFGHDPLLFEKWESFLQRIVLSLRVDGKPVTEKGDVEFQYIPEERFRSSLPKECRDAFRDATGCVETMQKE